MNTKRDCLETPVQIAKQYAGGGNLNLGTIEKVLEDVDKKLAELMEDTERH
jgi:hypothetical protein